MPRAPKPPTTLDPEAPPSLALLPEEDVGDDLWRALAELGEQSEKILLHRRYPNGRYGFVTEFSPPEFSLMRVRDEHGGGDYIAQFVDTKNRMVGKTPFTIDVKPEAPKPEPVAVASGNGHTGFEGIKEILDRQTELIKALAERQVPDKDPMDLALKLVEIVTAARGEQTHPFAEMAELFKTGVEIGRGAEGGGDSYWPVVEKFAPAIGKVLEAATARENAARGQPRRLPGPSPTPATTPEAPVVLEGPAWLIHLQPHLPVILSWARAGKDPALYAEVILDNLDPGAEMEVATAAKAPDFVEKTVAALPMFKPYSTWATQVLEEMKLLLLQEDQVPDVASPNP